MVSLLIVDDDMLAVEAISASVERDRLGISELFCAYSMQEAQIVLKRENIQILLCDIEMPRGSGLDLIEWVNNEELPIVALLLTSHADFNYAKRAIELRSIEYLLKPVTEAELNGALEKAIHVYHENKRLALMDYYQKNNAQANQEKFFRDLLEGNIEAIWEEGKKKGIEVLTGESYSLVLISFKHLPMELRRDRKRKQMLFEGSRFWKTKQTLLIEKSNMQWFVLGCGREISLDCGEEFVMKCEQMEGVDANCYYAPRLCADELNNWAVKLLMRDEENVMYLNKVFSANRSVRMAAAYVSPNIQELAFMILRGEHAAFYEAVKTHMDHLLKSGVLNPMLLKKLEADVMQAIYVAMQRSEIQANLLFADQESREYLENATKTQIDFEKWVAYIAERAVCYCRIAEDGESIIKKAIQLLTSSSFSISF